MTGQMDTVVLVQDFSGGLNNVDLIGTLADNELSRAENFDITSTGRLTSRPPFTTVGTGPGTPGPLSMLGWFQDDQGRYFAVVAGTSKTWLVDDETGAFTEMAAWAASDCEQYGGKLYLTRAAAAGGYWGNTTLGSAYSLTLLNGANPMPAGNRIMAHKGRLFVATTGAVYYSKVTSISAGTNIWEWDGAFINVAPGDGQQIVELGTSFNDIIVWRTGSTWLLSYSTSLSEAALTPISIDIGAVSWRSVARSEDSYYVLFGNKLYQLTSRVYYPLHSDRKLALRPDGQFSATSFDWAVSVFGERVIVWAKGTTYVMHLAAKGWTTTISSTTRFAHGFSHPEGPAIFGASAIFGISGSSSSGLNTKMYRAVDRAATSEAEEMVCVMKTKAFDWNDPSQFKKMFGWGVNVVSKDTIYGRAVPLGLISTVVTYDDMNLVTYDTLNLGTWDYPLVVPNFIEALRDVPGVAPVQVYAKMNQPLWFRQLSFEVQLSTDGTFARAPARIESIATIVHVKNRVPEAVN